MQWIGTVFSVRETLGALELFVYLAPHGSVGGVLIELNNTEKPKAIGLSKGDGVTFQGILGNQREISPLKLHHGVIVD